MIIVAFLEYQFQTLSSGYAVYLSFQVEVNIIIILKLLASILWTSVISPQR